MIPSLEELRKRLVPVVGPDSAPNSLFKRKPRLSTTPTRPNLPLPSDSPAPQHLSAPACDHSSAQTAPLGDGAAVEQPGAEIGVGSAHSDDQIVQDEKPITCAGETVKGISDRLPFDLKTLFSKLSLR